MPRTNVCCAYPVLLTVKLKCEIMERILQGVGDGNLELGISLKIEISLFESHIK